jgi:hypothetical protein
VWKTSTTPLQQLPSPVNNGWIDAESGSLDPKLMSQDPAPTGLLELTRCKCNKSACRRDDLCPCKANQMSCTEACLCMNDETCQNPQKPEALDDTDSDQDDLL